MTPPSTPEGPAHDAVMLHGYWRSSAAYRVRIASALKAVPYRNVTHDLRLGEQSSEAYRRIAPHRLVPALESGRAVIIESPAILEWIDQQWPQPPLLPSDATSAAIVRGMAALIACDIHPLNNLRVLNALKHDFGADQAQINAWAQRWIELGFDALERMIDTHGRRYAFGDEPTLADCYLIPQIYSAQRFGVNMAPYPRINAVAQHANSLPAFAAAHPAQQADADSQ